MLYAGEQPVPGYQLREKIGAGACGEVWKAEKKDGIVALKFIDCRSQQTAHIRSEIRILRGLSELSHPHIIQLHQVHATSHYIVLEMELADRNLQDVLIEHRLNHGAYFSPPQALAFLDQAGEGLDFLAGVRLPGTHLLSQGLQHCDVKPSNLLLCGEQLKIADFGLCAGSRRQMHRSGWRGTRPYAAPELYRGQAASGTDQYALAVTYCGLVFGSSVFLPGALEGKEPTAPIELSRLPEHQSPVIARALHPLPSARYASCLDFLSALRKALALDGMQEPETAEGSGQEPDSTPLASVPRKSQTPGTPGQPPLQKWIDQARTFLSDT
jgi:serine/threonine-protein kinase